MESDISAKNQTELSGKICRKCTQLKPLSQFERRPDARSGYRATCKDCRRLAKNATNRRWYESHKDQEYEKLKRRRAAIPKHYTLINARYHWSHREERNAKSRAYYRANRERLIIYSLERRRKFRSLDYGWTRNLANDRIQLDVWNMERAEQSLQEYVADLIERLSSTEQAWCEQFMSEGTPIPARILESIQQKLGAQKPPA